MNGSVDLMKGIYQTSFAIDDIRLFLDTHPDCPGALEKYRELVGCENRLTEEFESRCFPLTADAALDGDSWIRGPWPWEGAY